MKFLCIILLHIFFSRIFPSKRLLWNICIMLNLLYRYLSILALWYISWYFCLAIKLSKYGRNFWNNSLYLFQTTLFMAFWIKYFAVMRIRILFLFSISSDNICNRIEIIFISKFFFCRAFFAINVRKIFCRIKCRLFSNEIIFFEVNDFIADWIISIFFNFFFRAIFFILYL